ncbi:hypothetical protein C5167_033560 [Papaver somniferum]|uniref:Uncharacterized protein n=1 Tax=Papaver somniferum TaxID=3469 RepID=A0A4Y7K9V3_PAPSO|nr:hypothetical protein C5167_033560 [Papaver somniferum]
MSHNLLHKPRETLSSSQVSLFVSSEYSLSRLLAAPEESAEDLEAAVEKINHVLVGLFWSTTPLYLHLHAVHTIICARGLTNVRTNMTAEAINVMGECKGNFGNSVSMIVHIL